MQAQGGEKEAGGVRVLAASWMFGILGASFVLQPGMAVAAAEVPPLSATYLGGSGEDVVWDTALHPSGDVIVVGWTRSTEFPLEGEETHSVRGAGDAFVARFDPLLGERVSVTVLAGEGEDRAVCLDVTGDGVAVVGGLTNSHDFPVTEDAYDPERGGASRDGFLAWVDTDPARAREGRILYATYLGGSREDGCVGVSVDAEGVAAVDGPVKMHSGDIEEAAPWFRIERHGDEVICSVAPADVPEGAWIELHRVEIPGLASDLLVGWAAAGRDHGRDEQSFVALRTTVRLRPELFVRGDTSSSDGIGLADAVLILNHLFLGESPPSCADAADVDDNGGVEITDPIYLLSYLYLGGPPPAGPFPECGVDPTDDDLTCWEFPGCD